MIKHFLTMKKIFVLIPAVALALVSCVKTQDVYTGAPESREIAFQSVASPATRAAVDGIAFPEIDMKVTAYNATASGNYFGATTFSKSSSTWKGSKYWPLDAATINFLAIANANGDNETGVTWNATNPASQVEIVMGDNTTEQRDLMYACGTGTNTTPSTPPTVPMSFKHAQAWIQFNVSSTVTTGFAVNKITVNGVSCQGTYTVTHANWDKTAAERSEADPAGSLDGSVSGVWSDYSYAGNKDLLPDSGFTLSTTPSLFNSIMVVPNQGIASFTIYYTLDGNAYNYTYTPASAVTLAQATKYIYNITITLHEIEISPVVADWGNSDSIPVAI